MFKMTSQTELTINQILTTVATYTHSVSSAPHLYYHYNDDRIEPVLVVSNTDNYIIINQWAINHINRRQHDISSKELLNALLAPSRIAPCSDSNGKKATAYISDVNCQHVVAIVREHTLITSYIIKPQRFSYWIQHKLVIAS